MEKPYPSVEFETEITKGGVIVLPRQIAAQFELAQHITVRLTMGRVSQSLRKRNVTENEVESIATMQLEQRDQVLRFLNAEGGLAKKAPFYKRVLERKKQKL